jgi:hypothetical protein
MARQVQIMGAIYESTQEGLLWIGEDVETCDEVAGDVSDDGMAILCS